jgi:hypothetical protein
MSNNSGLSSSNSRLRRAKSHRINAFGWIISQLQAGKRLCLDPETGMKSLAHSQGEDMSILVSLLKYRFKVRQRIAEQRRKDLAMRQAIMRRVSIFDTDAAKEAKAALQALRNKDFASRKHIR